MVGIEARDDDGVAIISRGLRAVDDRKNGQDQGDGCEERALLGQ